MAVERPWKNQVFAQVRDRVWNQVGIGVWDLVWDQTDNQVWNRLSQIWNQTGAETIGWVLAPHGWRALTEMEAAQHDGRRNIWQ